MVYTQAVNQSKSSADFAGFGLESPSGYLGSAKSQILAISPGAIVHGDCLGDIRNVTIHANSEFHLQNEGKTLTIINSEICPKARIYAGSSLDDARVYGTMRGGSIKNTTIRASGEMNDGLATDADIYGRMNGGYIHKSTICEDGVVNIGESYNNQNIGQKVPLHRQIKDTIRSAVYSFFSITAVGKGRTPEKLPGYSDTRPATGNNKDEQYQPLLSTSDTKVQNSDIIKGKDLLPAYKNTDSADYKTESASDYQADKK